MRHQRSIDEFIRSVGAGVHFERQVPSWVAAAAERRPAGHLHAHHKAFCIAQLISPRLILGLYGVEVMLVQVQEV